MVSVSAVGKAKGGWPLPRDIFLSLHMPTCLSPTATPTRDRQDETWSLPFLSRQVLRGASALNLVLAPKASLDLQLSGGVTLHPEKATLLSTHGPHPTATHTQCSCMGEGRGGRSQRTEPWNQTIRFKPQLYYFLPGLCGSFTEPTVPQFPHV